MLPGPLFQFIASLKNQYFSEGDSYAATFGIILFFIVSQYLAKEEGGAVRLYNCLPIHILQWEIFMLPSSHNIVFCNQSIFAMGDIYVVYFV